MKLTFWGAAGTVTGSMHLLESGGKRYLLDCGLYQGRRKDADAKNRHLPFPGDSIDAVVLSHAHIDHSGNLPTLVKNGFAGPIYSTPANDDFRDITSGSNRRYRAGVGYDLVTGRGSPIASRVVGDLLTGSGTRVTGAATPAAQAAPVKHADETGWKKAGHKRWLWVVATTNVGTVSRFSAVSAMTAFSSPNFFLTIPCIAVSSCL